MATEEKIVDPTHTNQVVEDSEAGAALDAAFAQSGGEPADEPEDPLPAELPENSEEPAADPEPKAEVEEPAPADEAPEPRVPIPDETPVEEDPILKALDGVKLRADASQKTKDTFANLKQLSAEGLKAARAEVAKLRAEQAKVIETAKQAALEEAKKLAAVPEDVQKELEELRTLRARTDVESDPAFKQRFDAKQTTNFETVYGLLKAHALPDSELKALKAMSFSERVEAITDLANKLPASSKLKIEAKLFENLNLDDEKAKALEEARSKATQIYAEREKLTKEQTEAAKQAKEQAVSQFKSHELFKKIDVPVSTPPEEKKRLEAANAQAEKLQKLYDEVVNDETPLAKAEAAFGLVLAHKYKADLDTTKAQLQAAQKELDAIKKRAGVTDKGRVVNVPTTTKPPVTDFDAGSALDAFAKQAGLL
jgi:hypothetical protein